MSRITPMREPFTKTPKGSAKMRNAAKGQECTLQFECCNHDPETTVLCHIRMFGWAGAAEKPPDYLAVFACSDCHDALDGRNNGHMRDFESILRGLGNTLIQQARMGNFGAIQ